MRIAFINRKEVCTTCRQETRVFSLLLDLFLEFWGHAVRILFIQRMQGPSLLIRDRNKKQSSEVKNDMTSLFFQLLGFCLSLLPNFCPVLAQTFYVCECETLALPPGRVHLFPCSILGSFSVPVNILHIHHQSARLAVLFMLSTFWGSEDILQSRHFFARLLSKTPA